MVIKEVGKKNNGGARNIFGVVRKSTVEDEIGKKRGVSEEDPRSHIG